MPKKILGAKSVDEHIQNEQIRERREMEAAVEKRAQQAGAWKKKYDVLLDDYNALSSQLQAIGAINLDNVSPSLIEPTTRSGQGEATVLAMLADWHPYEVVKKRQVNGLNEFNPDICKASVDKLFRTILLLTDIERAGQTINNIVLAFLGDIIGNMIHDDQMENNAGTPQEEQLFVLFDLIIPGLTYLAEYGKFKKIYVKCSHGNHDRDTDYMPYNNMARHSHMWVIYHLLKRWFERTAYADLFDWDIAEGYHLYYSIYNRIIRQHHGDAFKYNGGIGGPTISIKRGIAQWESGKAGTVGGEVAGHADFDVFGHLHTTLSDATFASCPSLIGYSEFSLKNKLPYEPPAQRMLLLDKDPNKWMTADRRIYVR